MLLKKFRNKILNFMTLIISFMKVFRQKLFVLKFLLFLNIQIEIFLKMKQNIYQSNNNKNAKKFNLKF